MNDAPEEVQWGNAPASEIIKHLWRLDRADFEAGHKYSYAYPVLHRAAKLLETAAPSPAVAGSELAALLKRVLPVLQLYAHPWDKPDENNEPVEVPDLYSELDFGRFAENVVYDVEKALAALRRPAVPAEVPGGGMK